MERLHVATMEIGQHGRDVLKLQELLLHPLMQKKPKEQKTLKAALLWFDINIFYYDIAGKQPKLLETARLKVKHVEGNVRYTKIYPENVLAAYTQLADSEIQADNYSQGLEVVERVLTFLRSPSLTVSESLREYNRNHALYVKMRALRYLYRFDEALALSKTGCGSKSPGASMSIRFFHTFEYALNLLHTGRSFVAFNTLNELIQMNSDVGTDVQSMLRPLQILAQLELGNYQLIPYLIKSAKAWNKRAKISFAKYFDPFFSLTGAIAKARGNAEQKQAWRNFHEAVDAGDLSFLEEIHLKRWMEGKKEKSKTA
jgi:hypothetical protein